ncbi:MAG: hydantoinase/oxoprolinase family protein [Planctomycetota bacterium]
MRVGIDTGGTFTDLAVLGEDGQVHIGKVPSTPDDPGRALLAGLESLGLAGRFRVGGDAGDRDKVVHGTTVALNALLTGRLGRVALVTNEGFRDLIEIGRQDRPELYALEPEKPAALVPRERRFEVPQRSWPTEPPHQVAAEHAGGVGAALGSSALVEVRAPSDAELARLRGAVAASGAESIAVCLLHSYADPSIERRIAEALAPLGLPITCSAELLPAYREHERTSTALVNAALVPVVRQYLARLARELDPRHLELLQSAGGTLGAARAADEPARILLSGPAGGVIGAGAAAREAGLGAVVTLDMGGTSTDVAFHAPGAGLAGAVDDVKVAGHPVALPTLDLYTIGCGGGSLARVDAAGVLHVGPESAGADPGPVCYGRGTEPTVTDAEVHLGHVATGGFLGGELALDVGAVARAFERLGARLGVSSTAAAEAVVDVARAGMRRALGVMTMQRGRDPRRTPLVAFGGGGGLHAAALAEAIGCEGALVPQHPGVLSAWGMAHADALADRVQTVLVPLQAWSRRARAEALQALAELAAEELVAAGHGRQALTFETSLSLRYRGQSFELPLADTDDVAARFHAAHEERYGWRLADHPIDLVHLRARAIARAGHGASAAPKTPTSAPSRLECPRPVRERSAVFRGVRATIPVFDRAALTRGSEVLGPAIIEEFTATTLVPPGTRATLTNGAHLWLTAI